MTIGDVLDRQEKIGAEGLGPKMVGERQVHIELARDLIGIDRVVGWHRGRAAVGALYILRIIRRGSCTATGPADGHEIAVISRSERIPPGMATQRSRAIR